MGSSAAFHRCESRTEALIELTWAGIIPSLLAAMVFSAFLLEWLALALGMLTIVVALSMLLPAMRLRDERFEDWGSNGFLINAMVSLAGMLYIATLVAFVGSMLKTYAGGIVTQTDMAIMASLIMGLLITVFTIVRARRKLPTMERRFFRNRPRVMERRFRDWMLRANIDYRAHRRGRGAKFQLQDWDVNVLFNPIGEGYSEVIIDNYGRDPDIVMSIKTILGDD